MPSKNKGNVGAPPTQDLGAAGGAGDEEGAGQGGTPEEGLEPAPETARLVGAGYADRFAGNSRQMRALRVQSGPALRTRPLGTL